MCYIADITKLPLLKGGLKNEYQQIYTEIRGSGAEL